MHEEKLLALHRSTPLSLTYPLKEENDGQKLWIEKRRALLFLEQSFANAHFRRDLSPTSFSSDSQLSTQKYSVKDMLAVHSLARMTSET